MNRMSGPGDARWFSSSRTSSGSGNCVEAAYLPDLVAVRDSKDREGPMLAFPQTAWETFVDGIKRRHFDVG